MIPSQILYILSIVYVSLAGVALGVLQDTHSMGTTSVWLCSVTIVVVTCVIIDYYQKLWNQVYSSFNNNVSNVWCNIILVYQDMALTNKENLVCYLNFI